MSQPVEVYPNTVIRQPEPSHSNGSFGPVFIVLAVIFAVSAVACVLGRLCNRRHHRVREAHHHLTKEVHPHHNHQMDGSNINKQSHEREAHHHRTKEVHPHHNHPMDSNNINKQSHELGPKEWESRQQPNFKIRERGDVEFGFDKRIPSVRTPNNGGGLVMPPPSHNRPEVRFADNV